MLPLNSFLSGKKILIFFFPPLQNDIIRFLCEGFEEENGEKNAIALVMALLILLKQEIEFPSIVVPFEVKFRYLAFQLEMI